MFFNSTEKIQKKKEIKEKVNKLLSKGISIMYLKVTMETFSNLRFSGFEIFFTRSVFGELQIKQISLNLKLLFAN